MTGTARPLARSSCACSAAAVDAFAMFTSSIVQEFIREPKKSIQFKTRLTLWIEFLRGFSCGGGLGISRTVAKISRRAHKPEKLLDRFARFLGLFRRCWVNPVQHDESRGIAGQLQEVGNSPKGFEFNDVRPRRD